MDLSRSKDVLEANVQIYGSFSAHLPSSISFGSIVETNLISSPDTPLSDNVWGIHMCRRVFGV